MNRAGIVTAAVLGVAGLTTSGLLLTGGSGSSAPIGCAGPITHDGNTATMQCADGSFSWSGTFTPTPTSSTTSTTLPATTTKPATTTSSTLSTTTTTTTAATVPGFVTNLNLQVGNATATLSWGAPTSDGGSPVTGYEIWRTINQSGGETLYATTSALTFTDAPLVNGNTYAYQVRALNAIGKGPLSGEVHGTPQAPATKPAPPSNFAATASGGIVTLTWTAPPGEVAGYELFRGTSPGHETQLAYADASPYRDTTVVAGTKYYYLVLAYNSVGFSVPSAEVSVTP